MNDWGRISGSSCSAIRSPFMLASGVLVVLAAFPGLPTIPFLAMGSGLGYWAWNMRKKQRRG